MTDRNALHAHAVDYIINALRYRKHRVSRIHKPDGIELEIDGRQTAAVRVASPHKRRHRVTVNGRRYEYLYDAVHWNMHQHGRIAARPDVYFLVTGKTVFVVPAEVLGPVKSYSLIARCSQRRSQHAAVIRQYAGRWDVVGGAKGRRAAA